MAGIGFKLGRKLNNPALPVFKSWDYRPLLDALTRVPSLASFHTFTEESLVTKDGSNLVSAVEDLGPNGRTLTATGTDRPVFSPAGFSHLPSVLFDGTKKLENPNMFDGSEKLSIACAIWAEGNDGVSRIIVSDATDTGPNFYLGPNIYRVYSADVVRDEPLLATSPTWGIGAVDHVADTISLYTRTGVTTDDTIRVKPVGEGNIGAWSDSIGTSNRYIGHLGDILIFNEDLSQNETVRNLVIEYFTRKYRL